MTYPFDQISALGKANGQLATTLAQIARESGEAYVQIGGKAATAVFDQFKEFKPGSVPAFNGEQIQDVFGEIEKCRENSAVRVQAAFAEWQDSCKDLLSQAAGDHQAFSQNLSAWLQPANKTAPEPDKISKGAAPATGTTAETQ